MRCSICNTEYDGVFCPKCGWEEENILDDEYLKIYNQRKEKYKSIFENSRYYEKFFNSFILKFNDFLQEEMNLSFYLKFLDDLLGFIEDKKYYFELLVIKILILRKLKKDYSSALKEAEELSKESEILEEDRKFFNLLREKL